MSAPNWLGLAAALLTLVSVAELLRRGILRERFAALWLAVAFVLVFLALFPQALRWSAELLGFQVPANLLFFGSILFLLVLAAQLSSEISSLEARTRRLAEEVALLDEEVRRMSSRHHGEVPAPSAHHPAEAAPDPIDFRRDGSSAATVPGLHGDVGA